MRFIRGIYSSGENEIQFKVFESFGVLEDFKVMIDTVLAVIK